MAEETRSGADHIVGTINFMNIPRKPVRIVAAAITAMTLAFAVGAVPSSAATKAATKSVCKTVNGKKKCTKIVVKKKTAAQASDTTIASVKKK